MGEEVKEQTFTDEQILELRQFVWGDLADYIDPETGLFLVQVNGSSFPPRFVSYLERIRPFPVDEGDVYVTSFMKSGTTWLQHIVWFLMTQEFDLKKPIDMNFPELEFPRPYPPRPENLEEIAKTLKQPRLVKTHVPYGFLPRDVTRAKLIYVYRNLKDVIVSNFHHARAILPQCYSGTFEKYVELMLEGRCLFGPWHLHVKSYYEAAKAGKQILLLSYEEMKRDRMAAIKKIASYIGKGDLSEEVFQKVYDHTSFEAMKHNDNSNYSWFTEMGFWDKNLQPFCRKGVVGDWKNHFTPELQKRINDYLAKNMADCDLQFSDN